MADLATKIKNSLDEARLLILVVQVLLGFQMRAPFEERFASLSSGFHDAHLVALALLLAGFVLFVAPAPLLEIAFAGHTSTRVQSFTSIVLALGLVPFLGALAINAFIVLTMAVSSTAAAVTTAAFVAAGVTAWYLMAWVRRSEKVETRSMTHKTALSDRMQQVMTESRMIVPGAQALLGFQFATVFTTAFDTMSSTAKDWHVVAMCLVALATVCLIAPASFHRIAENGEDSERVVVVASRFVLGSLPPLALGIAIDVWVVGTRGGLSPLAATVLPALLVAAVTAAWLVYPLAERRRRRP